MSDFLISLLKNSVLTSVIMSLIVLAQDTILKQHHTITKFLWLLCLFHALIPFKVFSIELKAVFSFREAHMTFAQGVGAEQWYMRIGFWIPYIIFGIWLMGFVVLVVRAIVKYKTTDELTRCIELYKDNIYLCNGNKIAYTYGVFRQKIMLSKDIPEKIRPYVIAHENQHIKSRDNLFKAFYGLVKFLNWYNPLLWVWQKAFVRFIEIHCDARAIRGYSKVQVGAYINSLVQMAMDNKSGESIAVSGFAVKNEIKYRVDLMISRGSKPSNKFLCVLAALGICIVMSTGVEFVDEASTVYAQEAAVDRTGECNSRNLYSADAHMELSVNSNGCAIVRVYE